MKFKPMLAAKANLDKLQFPVLISPKLDGVRAVVLDGKLLTRSLKPVRNKVISEYLSQPRFEGLDGELIVGEPTAKDVYRVTESYVMSADKDPEDFGWRFFVFDSFSTPNKDYHLRCPFIDDSRVVHVPNYLVNYIEDLNEQYEFFLELGYEGVMLRDPNSPYKFGRSTVREGYLLKHKPFADSEGIVIDVVSLKSNTNELERDELGHAKRSTKKEGLVEQELLGSLIVRDLKSGVEFSIGTGFTAEDRKELWLNPPIGRIVRYQYFQLGEYFKPRFPSFQGFRSEEDL